MTYRRLVLQRARPAHKHYHYTKQNHNVSCILYKPQRLRNIKPNHQGTPKHHLYGVMVGHGVEYTLHQRFVPSRNPKIILTEIFSQISDLRYSLLEGNSKIHRFHLEISVSNVERDRCQLHQTFRVDGCIAFTTDVFPLVGAG